jgi:hypothetical protein
MNILIAGTPGKIVRLEKKLQFPPFQAVFARVDAVRVTQSRRMSAIAESLVHSIQEQIVKNLVMIN